MSDTLNLVGDMALEALWVASRVVALCLLVIFALATFGYGPAIIADNLDNERGN